MNDYLNLMILNGKNIDISKIELDKSNLLVIDKSKKYCFSITLYYNWKDINSLKVGEVKNIDFNEYILSENNESVLIWPSKSNVEKIKEDALYFHLEFNDLTNSTQYMNKRGHFDAELNSLEVRVLIDYKDSISGSIIYEFD